MRTLGVREPDVLTRVSEFVPAIVDYIAGIMRRGLAYAAGGSVYFDVRAFRDAGFRYGQLCPHCVENADLAAEGEANFSSAEKRSPADFALWKAARPGEPLNWVDARCSGTWRLSGRRANNSSMAGNPGVCGFMN